MKTKYPYLNFPLSLLQLFQGEMESKEALDIIIDHSFWSFVMKQTLSDADLARHIHYLAIREPQLLPNGAEDFFDSDPELRDGYDFFQRPPDENEYVSILATMREQFDLSTCEESARVYRAESILDMKIGSIGRAKEQFQFAENIVHQVEKEYGASPFCGIRTDVMFDVLGGKIPYDQFLLTSAVTSVIGKLRFKKSYKKVLIRRMMGAKTVDVQSKVMAHDRAQEFYDKYTTRYQWDKLLQRTSERGFFTVLADSRGYFVSTQYDLDELTTAIISKRDDYDKKAEQRTLLRDTLRAHQRGRRKAS